MSSAIQQSFSFMYRQLGKRVSQSNTHGKFFARRRLTTTAADHHSVVDQQLNLASFPVAIVGGGPTGLTLSLLLSKYGIRHVVFEKSGGLPSQPQAHFINHRSMEVGFAFLFRAF
mmetsp:Transcript_35257/g.83607  ORF Transcript_35257/g.83607 Transcript_35257/m.83607 type:complete len:115 (+) Transcript_35257:180-524(+)